MGQLIKPNYNQQFLFSPSVEEWVPADHPVRVIREVIEGAIAQGLLPPDRPEFYDGRPRYADSLLLMLWVYGYLTKFRSSRRLEWATQNVLPMVWLAAGLQPDHTTLSRFWQENRPLIREFFRMTVKVALKLGLVGMVVQAVDGTKLQAAGSTRKAMTPKQMRTLLTKLEEAIHKIEEQIESGENQPEQEARLTEGLQDRKRLAAAVAEVLKSYPEDERKRTISEPEAPMLVGTGIGYNAQMMVDAEAGIIVAQSLITEVNDERQLVPMLDKVKEELGEVAEETLADSGYNTPEALGTAAARGYQVVVNASPSERKGDTNPYHPSRFHYDKDQDVVICPQEKPLLFDHVTKRTRQSYRVRIYRGRECAECPVRNACTKSKRGRTIEISPHHDAVLAARKRREEPEKKALLKTRITFGERPFAVIKHILGIRRFRQRGKEKAAIEWSFIAGIQNLLQIMRHAASGTPGTCPG